MKMVILAFSLFVSASAFATATQSNLICHDQYTEAASTTKFKATITDSRDLANIEIQAKGVVLKSKGWLLSPYTINGYEVLLTGEHVTAMEAIVPAGVKLEKDFAVAFTIGAKWDQKFSIPSSLRARIDFNCDACGGAVTMEPNLYCSIAAH